VKVGRQQPPGPRRGRVMSVLFMLGTVRGFPGSGWRPGRGAGRRRRYWCARSFQDADGQVAQGGHGLGSAAGADLGGVFAVADIADVVQCLRSASGRGSSSRYSVRPGHWPDSSARSLAGRRESCSRAALIGDDDTAGTVFRSDHWIRHPHDLGTAPAPHPGERTRLPVINKPSRHYAETLD